MRRRTLAAVVAFAAAVLPAPGLEGQEQGDTLPPDTTGVQQVPDTAAAPADTVPAVPDSLVYRNLPTLAGGAPPGFETGVWTWSRDDVLASRAQTLLELLEEIPGIVPLRGGDYGTPEIFSVFGLGGGRVRVYLDGFEMLPLDGAVVDLAHVGLGGVEAVRVERGMGEVRIDLESLRVHDPRPMSLVEAGTGDLDTNHFRGTFLHPRALGGSIALAIERLDTRGTGGGEEGSRTGGWLRYTRHFGDRGGIRLEYRRATVQSALDTFPDEVGRSDWVLRARWELVDGLVAEAFTGASAVEGGQEDGLTPIETDRSQHGVRATYRWGSLWARGAYRLLSDPGLPGSALELEAGGSDPRFGGLGARWSRDGWEGRAASSVSARAWSRPFFGVSAFASWESGVRGARIFPLRVPVEEPAEPGDDPEDPEDPDEPEEPPSPTHRFTDRTGLRVGASGAWGPLSVGAAWLRVETDSLVPFGLHTDRDGVVRPGGEHTGFEVAGRLDLPLGGFYLHGALQQWGEEARYLPEQIYQGGLGFHDVFLESGNFELWTGIGVEGRSPMSVPFEEGGAAPGEGGLAALRSVPFQQSWNAFIHARILTVYLLIRWDNFTVRRNNQDYPGRVQPPTRATYGIRWTLWN